MQTQTTRTYLYHGQLERKLSTEIQSLSTGNTNYNERHQQAKHRPQRNNCSSDVCCHANTKDSEASRTHARTHAARTCKAARIRTRKWSKCGSIKDIETRWEAEKIAQRCQEGTRNINRKNTFPPGLYSYMCLTPRRSLGGIPLERSP